MAPEAPIQKVHLPPLHPVSVHFPQGLFPAAWMSLLLYLATGRISFESATYVMLLFGLLSMPVAMATGYLDWKLRYRGAMTRVFRIKIVGAFILLALALLALLIRLQHPEITALPFGWAGWLYSALLSACVATCIVVGHYGGRLVFH